jgi:hypothetical protein
LQPWNAFVDCHMELKGMFRFKEDGATVWVDFVKDAPHTQILTWSIKALWSTETF